MLSIAGIWSIYELKSIGSSVQDLLSDNYKSINASKTMIEALEREDSGILLLLLGNWDDGRAIVASADSLFETAFKIAENNITIPGEQFYVDSIRTKYQIYKMLWERPIVDTQRQGNINWYFETVHKSFLAAKSSVKNLMSLNDQFMFKTASELQSKANRAIMPGIVAIISALVFTILFNFFVNYYFVSPVIKITESIKRFLERKAPFDVRVETRDEIYDLAESISNLCNITKSQAMQ
jgi:methyl-accepting chemotaxis protein